VIHAAAWKLRRRAEKGPDLSAALLFAVSAAPPLGVTAPNDRLDRRGILSAARHHRHVHSCTLFNWLLRHCGIYLPTKYSVFRKAHHIRVIGRAATHTSGGHLSMSHLQQITKGMTLSQDEPADTRHTAQ
jgi:hypothetical protein